MPECSLGDCGISCEFGCSCVQSGSVCYCSCENQTLPMAKLFNGPVDADTVVSFTATEMSLVTLAEWFDALFPDQILIPAAQARSTVTTDGVEEDIRLGDLIRNLGLRTTSESLVGEDFSDYGPDS